MIRVKNKFLAAFLLSALIVSYISVVMPKDTNIVYAAESKALRDAQAKISHLTKSLKTNYLGIKNQAMWELYIEQARELIEKIPNSERDKKDALTIEVNKDEALVEGLGRINQVEKSIQPRAEGGYGNYLGIKNAETWREYLKLAERDLGKVDKSVFKKQYDELVNRMNKVSLVVKDIEDKFEVEYDKVVKLYEEARASKDLGKANEALREAEKLGTCERSDKLENDIIVFINNSSDSDNKIIHFPDEVLEKSIRNEIGKLSGSIYKSDVEEITTLNLGNEYIKKLDGIENLTNLQELDLYCSEINDIALLKNLTNLKKLILDRSRITDISPLENLTNLEVLYLGVNGTCDIGLLKNLTNLRSLRINSSEINNLKSLENLTKLQSLMLERYEISNISMLKNLTNLEYLRLDGNEISDISPLKNLTKLESLNLGSNNISDITPLKNLTNLNTIDLRANKISDISSLKNLTNLKSLRLNGNEISDITPLKHLINLELIDLANNEISDITPLKYLTSLNLIYLEFNQISDITPLKNLTNLQLIILRENKVNESDVQELEKHLVNCEIAYKLQLP